MVVGQLPIQGEDVSNKHTAVHTFTLHQAWLHICVEPPILHPFDTLAMCLPRLDTSTRHVSLSPIDPIRSLCLLLVSPVEATSDLWVGSFPVPFDRLAEPKADLLSSPTAQLPLPVWLSFASLRRVIQHFASALPLTTHCFLVISDL